MQWKSFKNCLGSKLSLELINEPNESIYLIVDEFWNEIELFEKRFSRFIDSSELSSLNKNCGVWMKISADFENFLRKGEELNLITNGYFDLMVEEVLSDLGYDKDYSFVNKKGKIKKSGRIEFDKEKGVLISAKLDLGGFGKGYALDIAKRYFSEFKGVCLNAGGDIYVNGVNAEGKLWKVYLEHPWDVNQTIGFVETNGLFLASSNSLKRAWNDSHHLIDPHLKSPANHMQMVYVQGQNGLLVDAMSTALYVMGYDLAKEFLDKNPLIEGLLVSKEGAIWKSPGYQVELFTEF